MRVPTVPPRPEPLTPEWRRYIRNLAEREPPQGGVALQAFIWGLQEEIERLAAYIEKQARDGEPRA